MSGFPLRQELAALEAETFEIPDAGIDDVFTGPLNTGPAEPPPEPAHGTGARISWTLAPYFLLRMSGLPFEVLKPLRTPRSVAWADQQLAIEAELDRTGPAVSEALEAAVPLLDKKVRRAVLAVRRDVFNRRMPRNGQLRLAFDRLPDGVLAGLRAWTSLRSHRDEHLAAGTAILADEVSAGREHLRDLASNDVLRKGILLASPSLDRFLPGYLTGPLDKNGRQLERSLLEYVLRTATKTSPFGTLTPVALGRFDNTDGPLVSATDLHRPRESHIRLNLAALARLIDAIGGSVECRADLPIELVSGCRAGAERFRYVRRTRRIGDEDAAVTIDPVVEEVYFLSRSQALDHVVAVLGRRGRMRVRELVDELAGSGDREQAAAYVATLLRAGFLTVPLLRLDIHHPDPVAGFRGALAEIGQPWADGLVRRLDTVLTHLETYPRERVDGRRRIIAAVRTELDAAQRALGRSGVASPRTLVYEDVTLGAARVAADSARWHAEILPALRGLCRILPLYDRDLPYRLTTKGFFQARHGRGACQDDVLGFVHEYNQDCHREFVRARGETSWFRLPELSAVAEARRELAASLSAGDAAEVVLGEEVVERLARLLPAELFELASHSFFLQVSGFRAVLNRVYSGLGQRFSRFAHCFPEQEFGLAADLAATIATSQPDGVVFAELTGGFDTNNLNTHPAVLPYELVCPGEVSTRPADERIPLDDLVIVDDDQNNLLRLRSRRLDAFVVPVYLGHLLPYTLPTIQRIIHTFSPNAMATVDPWAGRWFGDGAVRHRPRVRYGNLVLSRRQWTVDPADIWPRAASGAERLCEWRRWIAAHGIPEHVFVTDKPQYIDFGSAFTLSLMDNIRGFGRGRVKLTEMLPTPDELWLTSPEGTHSAEVVVELNPRAVS